MTLDPAASGPEQSGGFPGAGGAPSGHADPDQLADLAEGLLDAGTAEAVRAHLTSCDMCAEDFTLITLDSGISDFLPVEPIPAEVVARVEAALYREPPLRAVGGPATHPSHHAAKPSRTRRFKLAFGGLASVGLLVAGIFAGVSALQSGDTRATPSVGAAANKDTASVGAAPQAAAPDDGVTDVQQRATRLLTGLKAQAPAPAADTATPGHDGAYTSKNPSMLAGTCWQNPKPDETLLTSEAITYRGRSAKLLVYSEPGSARAHVVVVTAVCEPQPTVLADTEITRP